MAVVLLWLDSAVLAGLCRISNTAAAGCHVGARCHMKRWCSRTAELSCGLRSSLRNWEFVTLLDFEIIWRFWECWRWEVKTTQCIGFILPVSSDCLLLLDPVLYLGGYKYYSWHVTMPWRVVCARVDWSYILHAWWYCCQGYILDIGGIVYVLSEEWQLFFVCRTCRPGFYFQFRRNETKMNTRRA